MKVAAYKAQDGKIILILSDGEYGVIYFGDKVVELDTGRMDTLKNYAHEHEKEYEWQNT